MVDLRTRAEEIVRSVRRGERLILTYRGKPAVRLEPFDAPEAAANDPFYRLAEKAERRGRSLNNNEIDAIVYDHDKFDGE
jgi:prevent-host-death family protein